jgi:RNA polymerase sigma factor (sigma-70 family)
MRSRDMKALILIKKYCDFHESHVETSDEFDRRVLDDAFRAYDQSRSKLRVVEAVGVHPIRGMVAEIESETAWAAFRRESQIENVKPLTLEAAYQKYAPLVKSYARRLLDKWNHEEFESLVWERINKLIKDGRFAHISSERNFIFGILRKVAWEQSNKMRAQYEMISLSELSDEIECPPSRIKDAQDIAARRELLKAIVRFADTLDQPLPRIFKHYFLEGQNSAWISRKLHMNPNTVRLHIYTLRRRIDERFGDKY